MKKKQNTSVFPGLFTKKNSLVNSIDSSLDINNYNVWETPKDNDIEYIATLEKGKRGVPDTKIVWTNKMENIVGRNSCENIITLRPILSEVPEDDTELKSWNLFITDEIIGKITTETNRKIDYKMNILQLTAEMIKQKKLYYCGNTDATEIKAFIGLFYLRGLIKLNHLGVHYLFQDGVAPPMFGATMGRQRFQFLCVNISFDNFETRAERWKHDRFTAIREIYEMFNDRCSKTLYPQDYLSLDETLYSCRTRVNFKQFNSSKPAKYGLLFKSINTARIPYTLRTLVYAGKPHGERNLCITLQE